MTQVAADNSIRQVVSTQLPTKWGEFRVLGFEREITDHVRPYARRLETALAIVMGDLNDGMRSPRVRFHSHCFTAE